MEVRDDVSWLDFPSNHIEHSLLDSLFAAKGLELLARRGPEE